MNRTVLYVDDFQDNLTVFSLVYSKQFEVLTAASAGEALNLLRQHEVAVLLADQRMPAMTGAELHAAVKEEFPDTVRYLITAYADLSAAIDAINRGEIRRYLHKPWDHEELGRALLEGIEIYQMARKIRDLERRQVEVERDYSVGVCAARTARRISEPVTKIKTALNDALESIDRAFASAGAALESAVEATLRVELNAVESHVRRALLGASRLSELSADLEGHKVPREESARADLGEVVRLTVKMLSVDLLKRARLELQTPTLPEVHGSLDQLGQVVLNLLVGVFERLELRTRDSNLVRVSLAREGGEIRLSIDHNGPGFSEADRRLLFDPPRIPSGSGLGLAISRKIIQDLGGTLEMLCDNESQGTSFVVTVPVADT